MSGEKQSCETLLAGLGPAGLGVLTWLESIGALETILATTRDGVDHSIVVVDPRPSSDLGSGGLGYLATSNTTSSMFVRNLTQPQTVDPPPKPLDPLSSPVAPTPPTVSSYAGGTNGAEGLTSDPAGADDASSSTVTTTMTLSVPRAPSALKLLPSDLLQALRTTPEAKDLSGNYFIRLARVAPWFKRVWREIETKRFEGSRGKVLSGHYVHKVVTREDGRYDVHLRGYSDGPATAHACVVMTTTKLILATGGKARKAPEWLVDFSKKNEKMLVLSSEETLRSEGFAKVFSHLRKFCTGRIVQRRRTGEARVVVLGGAHSALSVIHTLLSGSDNLIGSDGSLAPRRRSGGHDAGKEGIADEGEKEERQQKKSGKMKMTTTGAKSKKKKASSIVEVEAKEQEKEKKMGITPPVSISRATPRTKPFPSGCLAMYPFMKDEIIMLHKREVQMFWANANEARKAGLAVGAKRISQGGKINTYTGLRGPSKALWRKIKGGGEPRVRTFLYPDEDKLWKKVDMCNPDVVVYATGYGFNLPDFENQHGKPLEIDTDYRGALNTTKQCQLASRVARGGGSGHDGEGDDKAAFCTLNNVIATGLGAGLRTTHSAIGGEKRLKNVRADGTNLYACQQARVVCREIWGAQRLQELANKAQKDRKATVMDQFGVCLPVVTSAVEVAAAGPLDDGRTRTLSASLPPPPVASRSRCTSPSLPVAGGDSDSDITTDSDSLVLSADEHDSSNEVGGSGGGRGGCSGNIIFPKKTAEGITTVEGKRRILGGSKPSLTTLRFLSPKPGKV